MSPKVKEPLINPPSRFLIKIHHDQYTIVPLLILTILWEMVKFKILGVGVCIYISICSLVGVPVSDPRRILLL